MRRHEVCDIRGSAARSTEFTIVEKEQKIRYQSIGRGYVIILLEISPVSLAIRFRRWYTATTYTMNPSMPRLYKCPQKGTIILLRRLIHISSIECETHGTLSACARCSVNIRTFSFFLRPDASLNGVLPFLSRLKCWQRRKGKKSTVKGPGERR